MLDLQPAHPTIPASGFASATATITRITEAGFTVTIAVSGLFGLRTATVSADPAAVTAT